MVAYEVTAQFYDAIATPGRVAFNRQIAEALVGAELAGSQTEQAPFLDIGAGTGLTLQVIADCLPGTPIYAIEPDAAMRCSLMTRVCSDPQLRGRVSILPTTLAAAPLPTVISGAVAGASLVHFSPEERSFLWDALAQRLHPAGRAIVEIQCPVSTHVPETSMASARIGQVSYEVKASADRIDATRQRWRVCYTAILNGEDLSTHCVEYLCWPVSSTQVLREAGRFGLRGRTRQDVVILYK